MLLVFSFLYLLATVPSVAGATTQESFSRIASHAEAARLAVGGIFLGVDFLDSIWEGYRFSIADVVADNTSGGGFLLGEQRFREPVTGQLRLSMDGELLTEGPVESLGDMGERLSWLSGEVGGLQAGQVIFLGSPAAAVPAKPGTLELRGPQESVLTARVKE